MNKFILIIIFVIIPNFCFGSFDTSLKYGSKGDLVVELQEFLTDQGFYNGKQDGRYGFGTLKAVKVFQTAYDLKPDGYFGKGSRAKANEILEYTKDLDIARKEAIPVTILSVAPKNVVDTSEIIYHQSMDIVPLNKEVTFIDFSASFSIQPRVDYVSFYLAGIYIGDKITLTIDSVSSVIENVVKTNGKYSEYSMGTEPQTLQPDTVYNYLIRIDRNNEFAIERGEFKTLK